MDVYGFKRPQCLGRNYIRLHLPPSLHQKKSMVNTTKTCIVVLEKISHLQVKIITIVT